MPIMTPQERAIVAAWLQTVTVEQLLDWIDADLEDKRVVIKAFAESRAAAAEQQAAAAKAIAEAIP
jgi:hypothetical protein